MVRDGFGVMDVSHRALLSVPGTVWASCRFAVGDVFDYSHVTDPLPVALKLPPDLAKAVPKRRSEFLAGRFCAALALRAVGACETVGRNGRAPVWPPGVSGSISHTEDRAMAVIRADGRPIGVDCETGMSDATASEVASLVLTGKDRDMTPRGWTEAAYCTLIFSAKEAVYKCVAGGLRDIPDFAEAEVQSLGDEALWLCFRGRDFIVAYKRFETHVITLAMEEPNA